MLINHSDCRDGIAHSYNRKINMLTNNLMSDNSYKLPHNFRKLPLYKHI